MKDYLLALDLLPARNSVPSLLFATARCVMIEEAGTNAPDHDVF